MPSLGADMDSGTLVEWRVEVGDEVHRGDIVAVVDTDKSTIEVEVFEDGVVDELVAAEGDEIPVGGVLARLRTATATGATDVSSSPGGDVPEGPEPPPAPEPPPVEPRPPIEPRSRVPGSEVKSSPRARRLAAAAGVDLSRVTGTGPAGAVTGDDLVGTVTPVTEPVSDHWTPERRERLRQRVGALMSASKRDIPHYYLSLEMDLRAASSWLTDLNRELPVGERVVIGALVAAAVARAAAAHPALNGHWVDDHHEQHPEVDLGMAVSLRGGGLLAPVIPGADRLGVPTFMDQLRTVVSGARAGNLPAWAMGTPTITATALGERGVDTVFGVIYPPQVAMVGVGVVAERPWADAGTVVAAPTVTLTVAADHRASNGHDGARFLAAVAASLAAPESLRSAPPPTTPSATGVRDPEENLL